MKIVKILLAVALTGLLASCTPSISYKEKMAGVKTIAVGSIYINKNIIEYDEDGESGQGLGTFIQNTAANSDNDTAKKINDMDYQVVLQAALKSVEGQLGTKFTLISSEKTKADPNFQAFVESSKGIYSYMSPNIPAEGMSTLIMPKNGNCDLMCVSKLTQLKGAFAKLADGPADAYVIVGITPTYVPSTFSMMGMGAAHIRAEVTSFIIVTKSGETLVELDNGSFETEEKVGMLAGMIPRNKKTEALLSEAAEKAATNTVFNLVKEL